MASAIVDVALATRAWPPFWYPQAGGILRLPNLNSFHEAAEASDMCDSIRGRLLRPRWRSTTTPGHLTVQIFFQKYLRNGALTCLTYRSIGEGVARRQVEERTDSGVTRWLAGNIFPFERELRARLRRTGSPAQEIDDIVQETYLQLAELSSLDHIHNPRSYFFAAAHAVRSNRYRRERVVRIDQLADRDAYALVDEAPGPERRVQAAQELNRVGKLILQLPLRCRQVFELRRVEGLSQRAIAERLGMSEDMVAYEASRGLRLLTQAMKRVEAEPETAGLRHLILTRIGRGRPRK